MNFNMMDTVFEQKRHILSEMTRMAASTPELAGVVRDRIAEIWERSAASDPDKEE